jgi:hypothetical protein
MSAFKTTQLFHLIHTIFRYELQAKFLQFYTAYQCSEVSLGPAAEREWAISKLVGAWPPHAERDEQLTIFRTSGRFISISMLAQVYLRDLKIS